MKGLHLPHENPPDGNGKSIKREDMNLKQTHKNNGNLLGRFAGWNASALTLFVVISLVNTNSLALAQTQPVDGQNKQSYDDQFEPNNYYDQATQLQNGQYNLVGLDDDWFTFQANTTGVITVTIQGNEGDLDLYLYDSNGNEVASSTEYYSNESVTITGTSGSYLLVVTPYTYQGGSYTLTLNTPGAAEPQPDNPEINCDSQAATKRALLVGIDHYDPYYGPGSLPSCINDAKGMRDTYLTDAPAENITLFTDSQATKSAIRNALQSMAYQAGPNDTIVYFHSSHGGQSYGTDTYLCTYNADYTDTELGYDLANFSSTQKVIVIVDACHSGGLYKNAEWPFARRIMKAYKAQKAIQLQARGSDIPKDLGANVAFITACNYNQTCEAGAVYSLFTEYFLRAGSVASADSNGDGKYQYWEIFQYASDEASRHNSDQTAQSYNQNLLQNTVAKVSNGSSPLLAPMPCGLGVIQTLTVGLLGLMGMGTSRCRWNCSR